MFGLTFAPTIEVVMFLVGIALIVEALTGAEVKAKILTGKPTAVVRYVMGFLGVVFLLLSVCRTSQMPPCFPPPPPGAARAAPASRTTPRTSTLVRPAAAEYHGNTVSRILHKADCKFYNCERCTAVFKTREEAIKAGYRPCRICNP
jgi:hypothetical protein